MKLPAKDDPGGDKEGELPRYIVLQTLRENEVNVEILNDRHVPEPVHASNTTLEYGI